MLTKKKVVSALGLLAWMGLAASASAQTWTYSSFTENALNAGTYGNSFSYTQSGVKLTVTAYSTDGTSGAIRTGSIHNWGTGSGFGVYSQTEGTSAGSPQHAMDNSGSTDFLALNFTNATTAANVAMNVTNIASGWKSTDSDVSLLYWSKATAPTITGGSIGSLLAAGWKLVNHYDNLVSDTDFRATLSTASSSWWLISSYNSAWGTGTNTSSTNLANLSNGDDFVKVLSSVTATVVPDTVPEPGSLALFAVAAAGLYAKRRQARQGRLSA